MMMEARGDNVVDLNKRGAGVFKWDGTGKYSEEGIYTSSTDGRGHSDRLNMRFPQGTLAQIESLIKDVLEFRSVHEFVRNAVIHAMHDWGEKTGNNLALQQVDMWAKLAELEYMEKELDLYKDIVDRAQGLMGAAQKARDTRALGKAINYAKGCVESLPEPYKDELERVIEGYEKGKG